MALVSLMTVGLISSGLKTNAQQAILPLLHVMNIKRYKKARDGYISSDALLLSPIHKNNY